MFENGLAAGSGICGADLTPLHTSRHQAFHILRIPVRRAGCVLLPARCHILPVWS